jgi:predicted tellurium resistance membrane protein TerC
MRNTRVRILRRVVKAILRIVLAYARFFFALVLVLVLIGVGLVGESFWFHEHLKHVLRMPYVVAAAGVGLFAAATGVRMLRARA